MSSKSPSKAVGQPARGLVRLLGLQLLIKYPWLDRQQLCVVAACIHYSGITMFTPAWMPWSMGGKACALQLEINSIKGK
jgi:hypothetical protein